VQLSGGDAHMSRGGSDGQGGELRLSIINCIHISVYI